jgi:hypothetical protein
MKNIIIYSFVVGTLISFNSYADDSSSSITLPVNVNLSAVQGKINQSIPSRIEKIDMNNHTCVEAEWLKTKGIPKCSMKGIKIYCKDRWIKTKTTPSISCDIDGAIDRDGPVRLSGKGSSFSVTIPIKASVTAKGRGAIGKNIQQTVKAATEITASVVPTIDENWDVAVAVDTNYRWTKRPEIELLNLIPVTVSSHVDPILKKELKKLEGSLPDILKEARIKENIETAWRDLQQPKLLDKKTNTYFLFEPQEVGFSQINISNNIMQAGFSINGHPQIFTADKTPNVTTKPLPKLGSVKDTKPEIFVELPIGISYKEIEGQANGFLKESEPINLDALGYEGSLKLSNVKLVKKDEGLKLDIDLRIKKSEGWLRKIDIFGWLDVKGTATFNLKPNVDSEKNILYMSGFTLDSRTNNTLADVLVDVANLKPIRKMIEKQLSYNFSKDVASAKYQINQALNNKLTDDVSLAGNVTSVSIQTVNSLEKKLEVPVRLVGTATLNVGL